MLACIYTVAIWTAAISFIPVDLQPIRMRQRRFTSLMSTLGVVLLFGAVLFSLTTLLVQRTWRSMKRWYRRATGPLEIPSLSGARKAVSSVSKEFRNARSRLMRVRTPQNS